MPGLVTLDDIQAAARSIRGIARVTPLVEISQPRESRVLLKCENLQLGGAFKIRGAANMVNRLSADTRRRGVITYSSGNHGRAVAIASQLAGIHAVVVMPTSAPAIKADAVTDLGAEVIFEGTTRAEECSAGATTAIDRRAADPTKPRATGGESQNRRAGPTKNLIRNRSEPRAENPFSPAPREDDQIHIGIGGHRQDLLLWFACKDVAGQGFRCELFSKGLEPCSRFE